MSFGEDFVDFVCVKLSLVTNVKSDTQKVRQRDADDPEGANRGHLNERHDVHHEEVGV